MSVPPALTDGRDPRSPYSRHVAVRLRDFTSPATPWPRRLWGVGSFLALDELLEGGEWLDRQVLTQASMEQQRRALRVIVANDPALASDRARGEIQKTFSSTLTVPSEGRRKLGCLVECLRPGYLDRWARHVAGSAPVPPERVARAVTAHLLDAGHSVRGLQRWLREGRTQLSAVALIEEAAALVHALPSVWRVVVPFRSMPLREGMAEQLSNWVTARDAKAMLRGAGVPERDCAAVMGGLRFRIEARDAERAVEIAYDLFERLQARSRFCTPAHPIVPFGRVIVEGRREPMALSAPERGAHVRSLDREKKQYAVGQEIQSFAGRNRSPVDDALEIAAALNDGPLAPAVAGGWAALESLLTDARDPDERGKAVAASRAAALVACSWPRAELTTLSYQVRAEAGSEVAKRLDACTANRSRARVVMEALRDVGELPLVSSWRRTSDIAAQRRMIELIEAPRAVLTRVRDYVEASLLRLYRCRNIVLHGGSTGGVALPATLRVAAPLAGAALDRVTHAHLVMGVSPLVLAAKADTALSLVGDEAGVDVCDLLE